MGSTIFGAPWHYAEPGNQTVKTLRAKPISAAALNFANRRKVGVRAANVQLSFSR